MRINPASIFGVAVAAVGVLFFILAAIHGHEATPASQIGAGGGPAPASSAFPYALAGGALLASGIIIALLGQLMRRSPKPTDPL